MSERKIFVVANKFAGKRRIERLVRELSTFLQAKNLVYEVFDTEQFKNATKTVSKKLDQTYTDLVIVGGDGTINEAVNGLQFDIPVAIVAGGTGNDFVRNVNIGKTAKEQFETAINGSIQRIDIGQCNDRMFLNGVGIGFDGQIVEDMIAKRVPLLTGHAAYYYHVLRILGSYKERPFSYHINDEHLQRDLILLAIGNGTTYGGGFKLMPSAKVDDGLLDVCEIGKLSPLKRFLNLHRLSTGSHGALSVVNFYQSKEVRIEVTPSLFAHIDGEWMGQPPFDIKILPKALQLRVAKI